MLTSSLLHLKSDAFGSKIAPSATVVTASSPSVANRGAHKTLAGLVFGAQTGQYCSLTLSIHLHGEFIAYVVMNTCSRFPVGPIWSLGPEFAPKITNISLSHCRAELRSRYRWPA